MCDARIRPFYPTNDVELECELDSHHERHESVLSDYAHPGSRTRVTWAETDRRNFRGGWAPCHRSGCILPHEHDGRHAA